MILEYANRAVLGLSEFGHFGCRENRVRQVQAAWPVLRWCSSTIALGPNESTPSDITTSSRIESIAGIGDLGKKLLEIVVDHTRLVREACECAESLPMEPRGISG